MYKYKYKYKYKYIYIYIYIHIYVYICPLSTPLNGPQELSREANKGKQYMIIIIIFIRGLMRCLLIIFRAGRYSTQLSSVLFTLVQDGLTSGKYKGGLGLVKVVS